VTAQPEQQQATRTTRPFTGAEYIESLRDGREVFIYGDKVKDVTEHPAFRNSVRSTARLYDSLHDPAQQGVLTTRTDTGARSSNKRCPKRDQVAPWSVDRPSGDTNCRPRIEVGKHEWFRAERSS